MRTRFYRLPGLRFDSAWHLGRVAFLPASEAMVQLRPFLESSPAHASGKAAQEGARERFRAWSEEAVIRAEADDVRPPQAVMDALAVLRFAARSIIRVNVESHMFGLPGDFASGFREFVDVLEDAVPPIAAPGWSRAGGPVPFTFTRERLQTLDRDPGVRLLRDEVGGQLSGVGAKALMALRIWDAGFRSLDPNLRILTAVQAVEILLSDTTGETQSLKIARRVAYLTCLGRCGRNEPHCLYTERFHSAKTLVNEISRLAARGDEWECSAFLRFAAPKELLSSLAYVPMYEVRNRFIHEGQADLAEQARSILLSRAEQSIRAALQWLADHPGLDISGLDSEMAAGVARRP